MALRLPDMTEPAEKYRLLRLTKDYWFLLTLIVSVITSIIYMYVFQVTPWDTYRQIELRRQRVALHDSIAQRLLESGQYEAARAEFDRAFVLDPLDDAAESGRYFADSFTALSLPTWDAAIWTSVREPLMKFASGRRQQFGHVVEKYLGDVEERIGNTDEAAAHYERALTIKPNYLDALYTYGWFNYSSRRDLPKMEVLFRKMTQIDGYDYRGYHGLGYALYMRALGLQGEERFKAIEDAAQQSQRASSLKFQQLNVTMDFGEVARCVAPELSKLFHEAALQLLDDPTTATLPQVKAGLLAQLLKSNGQIVIDSDSTRRAWIDYQLALDHLAMARKEASLGTGEEPAKGRLAHDKLLKSARQHDRNNQIYPIYVDQLSILDQFLPDKVPLAQPQAARSPAPEQRDTGK